MEHHFDIEVAKKYGIEEAIILNSLYYWIEKNKANGTHFYDGHYWTYNNTKTLSELFPYMSARQIDYAIKKLADNGLIIKGNYNKVGFDRTLWYAITNKGYSILQNCEMEQTKLLNGTNKIVEPIPINKTVNKPINKRVCYSAPTLEDVKEYARSREHEDLATKFYDYYTAGNWVDSNGKKVRNWKQKFITWCTKEKEAPKKLVNERKYTTEELNSFYTNIDDIKF